MFCAKFGWNWPCGSGWEEFKISSMFFRNFVIISPWKSAWPFIWTNLNPFSLGCFVLSLVEISPVVLEKKKKCEKLRRQRRRRTTDILWSEELSWAFGSGKLNKNNMNLILSFVNCSSRIEGTFSVEYYSVILWNLNLQAWSIFWLCTKYHWFVYLLCHLTQNVCSSKILLPIGNVRKISEWTLDLWTLFIIHVYLQMISLLPIMSRA